jgi:hypothetical protein
MTLWKISTLILCLFKNVNFIKAYLILNPFSYVFFTCTSFLCYLNTNMRAEKLSCYVTKNIDWFFSRSKVSLPDESLYPYLSLKWQLAWIKQRTNHLLYYHVFASLAPSSKQYPLDQLFYIFCLIMRTEYNKLRVKTQV